MKRAIGNLVLGKKRIPEWAVMGLPDPQELVTVLYEKNGKATEVTYCHGVISLNPLRIAVGLPDDANTTGPAALSFRERQRDNRELGRVSLQPLHERRLADRRLVVFRATGSANYCVSTGRRQLYNLHRWWVRRHTKQGYGHEMSRADLQHFFVVYTCPRPVSLLSVESADRRNLFPVDLGGPTGTDYEMLAINNNSPSLETLVNARQFALSRVPIELKDRVYELGRNHRRQSIDWSNQPLALTRSKEFGLPVARDALRVTELHIERTENAGSHTLILARPIHEEHIANGNRLHHVQGFFDAYLSRTQSTLASGSHSLIGPATRI